MESQTELSAVFDVLQMGRQVMSDIAIKFALNFFGSYGRTQSTRHNASPSTNRRCSESSADRDGSANCFHACIRSWLLLPRRIASVDCALLVIA